MKKKKAKFSKYSPIDSLRPMSFQTDLEDLTNSLYEKACCGSKQLWESITNIDNLGSNPELRRNFYTSAHEGMYAAQTEIIDQIKRKEKLTYSHEMLLRGIADAVAWQLIGHQLCFARRLFKGHNQPSIHHSNLDSVICAAENGRLRSPGSMALITDLTKFVQVGDLLMFSIEGELSIAEVKTGKQNAKISEFMRFYQQTKCDTALQMFGEQEGESSVKQLNRMMRQVSRMEHFREIVNNGTSVDPDTQLKVSIPDEFVHVGSWLGELNAALSEASIKNWSIKVIDGCLFLGCYSTPSPGFGYSGYIAFNHWFDHCGGKREDPRVSLLDAMQLPLALPIFSLDIPKEYKFDILFGRKHVCLGMHVEAYLEECSKAGLKIRSATNKEAARITQQRLNPIRYNNKPIFIGNGQTDLALMDGTFFRAFFHQQRPIHLTQALLENKRKLPQTGT